MAVRDSDKMVEDEREHFDAKDGTDGIEGGRNEACAKEPEVSTLPSTSS